MSKLKIHNQKYQYGGAPPNIVARYTFIDTLNDYYNKYNFTAQQVVYVDESLYLSIQSSGISLQSSELTSTVQDRNKYTISFWIKPTGFHNTETMYMLKIGSWSDSIPAIEFFIDRYNKIGISRGTTVLTSSSTILLNEWYHVAATYNGNNLILYVNGISSGTISTYFATEIGYLFVGLVGTIGTAGDKTQTGYYKDLMLFSRALDSTEIQYLYSRGAGVPFDENKIYTVEDVLNSEIHEEINGAKELSFSTVLTQTIGTIIDDFSIVEHDEDYYDIAAYKKFQSGQNLQVDVECEHVSYRLNNKDYDVDYFTCTGTPTYVLGKILEGTDFIVGTVEFTDNVTYSIQEAKSRRALLMEFVAYIGGEVDFSGFVVSILTHRGSSTPKDLTAGRNITVISKNVNKRERDSSGNPIISYECDLVNPMELNLGDVVTLDYDRLDINISLRIVSITKNPYNRYEISFQVGNKISGVQDDIYKIETSTVAKNKVYNGVRISPDDGFIAERSDKMSRMMANATEGYKLQLGDGTGSYSDTFYVVIEEGVAKLYLKGNSVFEGQLKIYDDNNLLLDIYKNANGGLIILNDANGNKNISLGSESGEGNNVGGTMVLHNDGAERVVAGINSAGDYGTIQVKDASGQISYLTPTVGVINGQQIATIPESGERYVKNYNSGDDIRLYVQQLDDGYYYLEVFEGIDFRGRVLLLE